MIVRKCAICRRSTHSIDNYENPIEKVGISFRVFAIGHPTTTVGVHPREAQLAHTRTHNWPNPCVCVCSPKSTNETCALPLMEEGVGGLLAVVVL